MRLPGLALQANAEAESILHTWIRGVYPRFCRSCGAWPTPAYKHFANALGKLIPRKRVERGGAGGSASSSLRSAASQCGVCFGKTGVFCDGLMFGIDGDPRVVGRDAHTTVLGRQPFLLGTDKRTRRNQAPTPQSACLTKSCSVKTLR
jgi:hypothetical protein